MKRIIVAFLLLSVLVGLCACSGQKANQFSKENSKESFETGQDKKENGDEFGFKCPSEIFKIDLSQFDPSNEQIKFLYDDEGKITQCRYQIDDREIVLTYTYSETSIQIYGFSNDIVVADKSISISQKYDSSIGFSEHEGYYLKGYN